ncbi:ABC transporter substrate-binding protein [Kibdelosporangium persicum]|uniref:ABC-type Fe3+-hydroxamate transport system, periplasmic component n=1 Tax=Kibdelosporangium persicum TaxID=2698649 RepID=A0ABX2F507_9PSEU|nr:ABC transporter substrate-binding protein [Kibdelosporangium persicum]NRN66415.1 ABC-type Fe3+-hydroxamate transport system, periplasmic component [Kibdelosporangium persicum]
MQHPIRRSGLVLVAAVSMLATACGGDGGQDTVAAAEGFPMTVKNCGRDVTFERRPERLYVIGGEAGTLVHAAGGTDRISTFSPLVGEPLGDAAGPLGQREQAPIKSSKSISREVIIGAKPDLVVTYGLNEFGPEDLQAAGIPTLIISGYCGGFGAGQSEVQDPLEGVYADIETLGRVLGTEDRAKQAVTGLKGRVEAVRQRGQQSPPPSNATAAVFVAGPDSALNAYGRRSMIHQQMSHAGLTNVFQNTDERLFDVNTEALISSAPQRLIALYEPGDIDEQAVRASLTGRPELGPLPAVAGGKVMVLDFFYSGHGTLAVDGLEKLAGQVHG